MLAGAFLKSDQLVSNGVAYLCGTRGKRRVRNFCGKLSCIKWGCWSHWRVWMTILMIVIYIVLCLAWLSSVTYVYITYEPFSAFKTWYLGLLYILGTTAVTFISVRQHWIHYTSPPLQNCIVQIALFVQFYGYYSWLALRFPKGSVYFSAFREIQEAYVIYAFFEYLLAYLKIIHHSVGVVDLLSQQPPQRLCCCCVCKVPKYFIKMCKIGVLQFSVVRVVLTAVTVGTEIAGVYGEGSINFSSAYPYVQALTVISQIVAMAFLAMFYRGTSQLLKPINPLLKFATVQCVIFITSFQQLLLSILSRFVIRDSETWEKLGFSQAGQTDPSTGIQNLLITIEMFVASIAVFFIFSYNPFVHHPNDGDVPVISTCIKAFQEEEVVGLEREEEGVITAGAAMAITSSGVGEVQDENSVIQTSYVTLS